MLVKQTQRQKRQLSEMRELRLSLAGLMAFSLVLSACSGNALLSAAPSSEASQRGDASEAIAKGENSQVSTRFIPLDDGRTLELEVGMPGFNTPDAPKLSGIIVFGSGANLSPESYRVLTASWTDAGYAVFSPLFIDSERHPQRDSTDQARILRTRLSDYQAVTALAIDEMGGGLPLIAAGHSYGAYIAQILGGAMVINPQTKATIGLSRPAMLKGVVALSPPPAVAGFSPPSSWETMVLPMLVQTGTSDVSPPFVSNWEQHLDSHCGAPKGMSWSVVYRGIDHYFGGLIGRPVEAPTNAATQRLDRFIQLSIIFMNGAISGQKGLSEFGPVAQALSDNGLVTPAFECPPVEQ